MRSTSCVFIIDDEQTVRDALSMLLETAGYFTEAYADARSFFAAYKNCPTGCIILDVDMPEMDGLAVQQELNARQIWLPMLFLTGKGTIPMTVRALKAGAMDFMTKPLDGALLLSRVQQAVELSIRNHAELAAKQSASARLAALSEREQEILKLLLAGLTSKEMAAQLGISARTVEVHRANIMRKMAVSNLVELAQLAL